jgi:hypothetical protein
MYETSGLDFSNIGPNISGIHESHSNQMFVVARRSVRHSKKKPVPASAKPFFDRTAAYNNRMAFYKDCHD